MTDATTMTTKAFLVPALMATALVAGCGKKNDISPPDGQEGLYTYPRAYPAPLPGSAAQDRSAQQQDRLSPPSSLSPYPFSREGKTKTYGSSGS